MNPLNQCTCTQLELQKEDIPAGVGEMLCNCNIGFIVGFSILLQRYSFIVYFQNKYVKRNVQT